jgi:hypothetical protein
MKLQLKEMCVTARMQECKYKQLRYTMCTTQQIPTDASAKHKKGCVWGRIATNRKRDGGRICGTEVVHAAARQTLGSLSLEITACSMFKNYS